MGDLVQFPARSTGPESVTRAEVERVYREFDGHDHLCAGILLGVLPPTLVTDEAAAAEHVWGIVRHLRPGAP